MSASEIRIWAGKISTKCGEEEVQEDNQEIFVLDVETLVLAA